MTGEDKIHILLVDDRPENLISLKAILDAPEYELVTAESGRDALKRVLEQDFALILLDVQMPIMDGFETANLIKSREKSKHVPIIFVTALNQDVPFMFRGYSVGAVDYIIKPFDPAILRSKVSVFADLHQRAKLLEKQAAMMAEHERMERERLSTRLEVANLKKERSLNEKYKDLVDGIEDGVVWITDLSTMCFSFVSPHVARIIHDFGSAPSAEIAFEQELIKNPVFSEQRKVWQESLKSGCRFNRDFHFEHKIKKAVDGDLWLQTSVRLANGTGAAAHELRGLTVDITKIKKAQEEAQDAIRVRDQFLSIASHELKTPLTPLCLQLDILQKVMKSNMSAERKNKKIIEFLDRMQRQVDRLTHLIDGLLDVSRINSGKLLLDKESIQLSGLVADICERLSHDLAKSGSKLQVHLDQRVLGNWDRMRLEQVLVNLLMNAIKYGDGKPIEIKTEETDDQAIIKIRDHGIGIKPEDQERIFQLYERAVSAMHFGGLGLGLYIVRQIVEAHQGTITVESEFGKGSTFTVNLPLKTKNSRDYANPLGARVKPSKGAKEEGRYGQ